MANVIKGNASKANRPRPGQPAASPREAASKGDGSRAREILDEAKQGARAILDEARTQVTAMLLEATELGQQEGFSQAEHMRQQIVGLEQRMLKEVEGEVVRTALKVAEVLLTAELEKRDEAMVDLAVAALAHASDAREVWLRVNPAQVKVLRQHQQRLVDALMVAKEVDVREDRKVKPGGVLIQTEAGVIDATLETQLAEIARVLGA